jgi:hypothetical protein
LGIFDLNTGVEGWSLAIRDAVGQGAFNAALQAGGRDPKTHLAKKNEQSPPALTSGPEKLDGSVRDMVLHLLKEAGAKGIAATAIRKEIETSRGAELHYKTVGMTLYRLSQDKLARREGRTWFATTANPGAATPGLSKSAK